MPVLIAALCLLLPAVSALGDTGQHRPRCTPGTAFLGPGVGEALAPLIKDGGRALELPDGIAVVGVAIDGDGIAIELGKGTGATCRVVMAHRSRAVGGSQTGRWFAAEEQGAQHCQGMGRHLLDRIENSVQGDPWTVCKGQPARSAAENRPMGTSPGWALAVGAFNLLVLAAGLVVALMYLGRGRD